MDVVLRSYYICCPYLYYCLNNGDGSSFDEFEIPSDYDLDYYSNGHILADIDNDGDDDIISRNSKPDFGWYENKLSTGDGFVWHSIDTSEFTPNNYQSGDINNDGLTDIVTELFDSVFLFINLGAGSFDDKQFLFQDININTVTLADLQNDNLAVAQ